MRFHVVGMGPIGCLLSFHLRRALGLKHSITVIHKLPTQVKTARRAGGTIKLENGGVVLPASGYRHQSYNLLEDTPPKPEEITLNRRKHKEGPLHEPQESVSAVFFDGLKKSVQDLFSQRRNGLLRTGKFWSRRITRSRAKRPARPVFSGDNHIDSLFVCVKAQSTLQTIRDLLPRLSSRSTIVLLQNGMGVYEELITHLFPNPTQRPHIITAVISHGAWLKGYLHVVHAGVGKIDFGIMPDGEGRAFEASYNNHDHLDFVSPSRLRLDDISHGAGDSEVDRCQFLRETVEVLLSMEPLRTNWIPLYDVQMAMRRKVVVNAVLNPLTAVLDCKNGHILTHQEGRHLCRAVCREAEAVFRAQWEHERREAGGSDDDGGFPSSLEASQLEKLCMEVAAATSENISSMLADVRLARPTEIRYMTGYLIDLGKQYGVRTLTNLTLYNMVQLRSAIHSSDPRGHRSTAPQ